ncbi:alpha/beta fold hydrolase [Paraphotobacterium marinum]|uniref:alpha/beta fold hydrolase n=1 Tax=Paraphotobacterium marinum TaxID=1755811 RepID=UPI00384F44A7
MDLYNHTRKWQSNICTSLYFDYQNNVKEYPQWQKYLRDNQPPMLVVWGKNDLFFPESGAIAYKKDLKEIDYNILDTGHFPLEEEGDFIISKIRSFMKKNIA